MQSKIQQNRRQFVLNALATVFVLPLMIKGATMAAQAAKITHTEDEWKQRLSPQAYHVLREHGTERAFTSPLNDEKRKGIYHCAGCDTPLFDAAMKFDSGTGWPSFFDALPGVLGTKTDYKIVVPRTEYHCLACGGHQGHVFDDGPAPTGLRYCNNGVCLTFRPEKV